MKKNLHNFAINILLCLFSIIICMVIGDMLLGFTNPKEISVYEKANWLNNGEYKLSVNPKLGWESSKIYYENNKIITRTNIYPIIKPQNKTRIVMLGDSITEGAFVQSNETFSYLLENSYNKDTYEVINLGVTGYNLFQYSETLKKKGLILKPDVVIVCFFINDFLNTPIVYKRNETYLVINYFQNNFFLDNSFSWFLYRHSRIYREIYKILVEKTILQNFPSDIPLFDDFLQYRKSGYNQIIEIKKITESNNITLLVAVVPQIIKTNEYNFIDVHREIINFLQNNSIDYIDLLPIYDKNDPLSMRTNISEKGDIDHPNQKGHRIIANELRKKLDTILIS